jgi:protein SCO1
LRLDIGEAGGQDHPPRSGTDAPPRFLSLSIALEVAMNRQTAFALVAALALVAAIAVAAIYALLPDRSETATPIVAASSMPAGGPFALLDGTGATITDQTFRGRWELVFFGYIYCPDLCPTTLSTIAEALRELGPLAAQIQPIFITIDPRRDTPETVGAYVRNFDPRIVGLTGSPEAIAAVAAEYKIYYAVHKTGDGPDDYLMDHSGFVYLMNPEGKFARVLSGEGPGKALADRLRPFLSPIS